MIIPRIPMPNTRLHILVLPVVTLAVLQLGGCSKTSVAPAPPGGTYFSESAGANFDQYVAIAGEEGKHIANFPLAAAFRAPYNTSLIYIASGNRGIVKSEDGGKSWTVLPNPLTDTKDVVALENGTIIVSGTDKEGQGYMLRSLDAGKSWHNVLTIPLPKKGSFALIGQAGVAPSVLLALTLDPFNTNRVYAGSSLGTIFVGEQSAKVWRSIHSIKPSLQNPIQTQADAGIRKLIASPHRAGELLAITTDRRLLRISGDKNEEIIIPSSIGDPAPLFGGGNNAKRLVFDAAYIAGFPAGIIAGVENGGVATRDGGKSWLELKVPIDETQKFSSTVVAVSPTNVNRILVAVNSVIYRSEDGGDTWNTFSLGLPNSIITDLLIDPSNASRVLLITAPIPS